MAYIPWATSSAVRSAMQGNRSRDTRPELRIRRAAHRSGPRYFVDRQPLVGLRRRADMVFPTARIAVFVDGCYWHGCPSHYSLPRTNPSYWSAKVARNVARDTDTNLRLSEAGWEVLRFWEHEDPDEVVAQLEAHLRPPRGPVSPAVVRLDARTPLPC